MSHEDFFRTLADALPQIVWTARPDGTPEYSNQRWSEFSGLAESDTPRDGWLQVTHPDDYDRCLARWRECVSSGEVYEVEARFRRAADGIYRWHLSRCVPVRGEDGEIVKWFGTCTDIHEQKRLQQDYAHSEERLSLAMDAAQLGFWDWNITTGVVVWSDHAARLIHDESDVFEGTFAAFLARLYPPDRERVVTEFDRAVREMVPCEIDFRVVWADESVHWMSGRGRVYADADGRAGRMIGVVREITERKKAEESLRESLNILRAVSQGTSDAIFVKDIDGRYLLVNPTTALIFNRPEAQIIGHDDTEMITPEDARQIMATDRRIMTSRQPELIEETVSVRGVTRTFLSTKSPYFDEGGEVIGLIGIATDITERKKIEEALRTSEALYRNLTEAMPQIVFTSTPAGKIDYVNHPLFEETGVAVGREGDGWITGLHPDDEAAARAKWDDSVSTGAVFETEFRLHHRATDKYRWHLCRAVPMRDAAGQIFKWIGTITDIDDWKRADEERRELLVRERAARAEAEVANRTKDEFLATLSHELRTPLTAMLGWARMLRSGKLDGEGNKRALEIIERNALVQTQLIEDILDVSRIITGKFRLDVQPISLRQVVASALDVVRPAAEAKTIDLQFSAE
ncbi:MAG TPA: PAS domain-containing protein, partial [Pyrinomonadaceae bacterium]|nr:PAS domain-containing protein [Pyrinomonadaceae bacterium]